jgi:hypothetical protein
METLMNTRPRWRTAVLIAWIGYAGAVALAQTKVDVTGKWIFEVTTDAGTGTPTVTFKQDGEKLTGHYSSTNLGEADLTGTVKGAAVSFKFNADLAGTAVEVTYVATVEGKDAMKGTIDIGGVAGGTFTGRRQ